MIEKLQVWFRKNQKVIGLLLYLMALLFLGAASGIKRIHDVDFVCTNGDYQNYNALRRVLAGQTPYVDFSNYLGMGILWLCTPLVALCNNLAGSMFVTNAVCIILFAIFVTLVFYLIGHRADVAMFGGIVFAKLLDTGVFSLLPAYGYYTSFYLGLLEKPKNSFRMARMFLCVLFCGAAILLLQWAKRKEPDATLRKLLRRPRCVAAVAFVVGLGVTWSNDFGFACIGSSTLVLLILAIADAAQGERRNFRRFLFWFPALLAGMFCSAMLATGGHPGSYLSFTADVGSWQFWYYGVRGGDKYHSLLLEMLSDKAVRRSLIHWGIYVISMLFCLWKLCRKQENDRMILFVFLFTSVLAGQMVYIVGSGGDNFTEGVYGLVTVAFWAVVLRGVQACLQVVAKRSADKRQKRSFLPRLANAAPAAAMACVALLLCAVAIREYKVYAQADYPSQENYIPQLGGVSPEYDALTEMEKITGGGTLFSTYATALDDMRGEFQPTGNDYIIHALGDKRFAAYADEFVNGEYTWVQTTNTDVWPWEDWAVRASWPFYKQMFSDYRLYGDYHWWTLWRYEGESAFVLDAETEIKQERLSDSTVKITVNTAAEERCYVDVCISWESEKTGFYLGTLKRAVYVEDTASQMGGYFRDVNGTEVHIPVVVENGTGSVTISSQPEQYTQLTITKVSAGDVILAQK